jgi:hypothetical protein
MRDWYYGAFHFEKKMLKKTTSARIRFAATLPTKVSLKSNEPHALGEGRKLVGRLTGAISEEGHCTGGVSVHTG